MAMRSGSGTTLVRKSVGQRSGRRSKGCEIEQCTVAYEGRNVFITSLPEVLLLHMDNKTAEDLYKEWTQCETIIGPRPTRGRRTWHVAQ